MRVAEQFLCQICNNMIIPGFTLGADGVQKSSIKIPQCLNCDQLACYNCWLKLLEKDEPHCPKCDVKLEPLDKKFFAAKDATSQDSEHDYD